MFFDIQIHKNNYVKISDQAQVLLSAKNVMVN